MNLFKSNTEKFYRGYGDGFYGYDIYNYSSYESRRIGAHSGSSSDDLFFIIGIRNSNSFFITFNKERHGIKSKEFPELKNELTISYNRKISSYLNFF